MLNELRQRTTDLTERTTDLTEALEQQTATSDVLQVISSSPGDLQPVFETMLEKAVRICDAKQGNIYRWDNEIYLVATHNTPSAFAEARRRSPSRPNPKTSFGRMIATKAVVHVADAAAEPGYVERHDPATVAAVELGGVRTALYVPMLKESELIGAFTLARQEVRPFTDKQIALVTNFAAQAVIAIENARLLNELREALEQQTATANVLHVINSSPGHLKPVFEAMLESATRICEASFGSMLLREGERLRRVAVHNAPPGFAEFHRQTPVVSYTISKVITRIWNTKQTVHIVDLLADDPNDTLARFADARTLLVVPLLKDDELVGIFGIYRQEVRPFTGKQIALVQNFAAQAVIAIENARLLNELRQRTADLSEALEQQSATSNLLQVISGSSGNLEPVFQAMLENAVTICGANLGNMFLYENDAFRTVAMFNAPEAYASARTGGPFYPPPESGLARVATKDVIQIADARALEGHANRDLFFVEAVELGRIRTLITVPLLKEGYLIGAITIYRQEVRPFTEKQIELVKNFASQVVIAIENSRLLNELRARTNELERSYALVRQQARQLEAQAKELEQRVADQVGEIERIGRLRRFLPPQVADLTVASGSEKQLESHRREITALFCDLRGFTGFTESADAEDVMALLRDYHAAIGEIMIKYNGTLERYAGDGVMVVFNEPVPVENPALQAVLMALEMRDAIGALTATWSRLGHEIGFGIGIAHGFATLGTIGFEGRFDYAAIGTVSNVASRLCDEAKPGQILISPRVLMKVENAVKVEPVGEFELKGIRRPLAAYNVVASKT